MNIRICRWSSFCIGIIVFLGLTASRVDADTSAKSTEPSEANTKKTSPTQALLDRWNQAKFTPFNQFDERYTNFSLPGPGPRSEAVALSEEAKSQLQVSARSFLAGLRAKSFKDCIAAIKGSAPQPPTLRPAAAKGMRKALKSSNPDFVQDPDSLSDWATLENFWIIHTQIGRGASYFTGIALDESYYTLRKLTSMAEVAERPGIWYAKNRIEFAGMVESESFFDHSISPAGAFKRDGSLIVADLKFLIQSTNYSGVTLSYPFMARCFWDNKTKNWFFTQVVELYSGRRQIRPIF